ncbi:hypothetical protein ACFVVM_16025 [Nocardia sp. NPDC058176]|uniref:hypothetical protein n=1 Tax=Nocardia sp. NPDC058176 TaxID=3346368 RepID=UPI0036D86C1B
MLTEESLTSIRTEFDNKVKKLDELPDLLNEGYDRLKWVNYVAYHSLSGMRDEIQAALKKLVEKIKDAVEGMFAPWLFVDYASKWQQVGNAVSKAYGIQNNEKYNLEGDWDGSAYKSYNTSKGYQATAMTTVADLCNKVHDQLLAIAEEGRSLYKALIDKLATVITNIVTFASESAASAGTMVPFTLPTCNAAVAGAVELAVEYITNFAEVQTKVWIASNELQNMIVSPQGLAISAGGSSVWPTPNSTEYDNKEDGWELDGQD